MSVQTTKKTKPTPVSMLPELPSSLYFYILNEYTPPVIKFDFFNDDGMNYLWKIIKDRGSVINICFSYISKNSHFDGKVVSVIEFDRPLYHTEIYFGEHVCRLVIADNGPHMFQSPAETHSLCEMVSLPFNEPKKAFEIGLDILKRSYSIKSGEPIAKFDYHPTEMVEHFLSRLFFRGHGENDFDIHGDYNPLIPEEWTRGVHCSQYVLLFLKRCVLEKVLYINPTYKEHFLNLYSFTCLPSGLRTMLKEIWPQAKTEFIDYTQL